MLGTAIGVRKSRAPPKKWRRRRQTAPISTRSPSSTAESPLVWLACCLCSCMWRPPSKARRAGRNSVWPHESAGCLGRQATGSREAPKPSHCPRLYQPVSKFDSARLVGRACQSRGHLKCRPDCFNHPSSETCDRSVNRGIRLGRNSRSDLCSSSELRTSKFDRWPIQSTAASYAAVST
jgi:hypothetical protein